MTHPRYITIGGSNIEIYGHIYCRNCASDAYRKSTPQRFRDTLDRVKSYVACCCCGNVGAYWFTLGRPNLDYVKDGSVNCGYEGGEYLDE